MSEKHRGNQISLDNGVVLTYSKVNGAYTFFSEKRTGVETVFEAAEKLMHLTQERSITFLIRSKRITLTRMDGYFTISLQGTEDKVLKQIRLYAAERYIDEVLQLIRVNHPVLKEIETVITQAIPQLNFYDNFLEADPIESIRALLTGNKYVRVKHSLVYAQINREIKKLRTVGATLHAMMQFIFDRPDKATLFLLNEILDQDD